MAKKSYTRHKKLRKDEHTKICPPREVSPEVIKAIKQAVPNPTSMNPKHSKYQQKNEFIL